MGSSILSINSNISSFRAQRQLRVVSDTLSSTFEKLNSGLRINRASDDAAGLAISENLKASTRVYTQAVRNLNDGMSYLAIGEGALHELSNITTRQIELSEQSANGVFSLAQRRAMNTEANALSDEFNRIVQSTDFNGRNILDLTQSGGDLVLQGGYGTSGTLQIGVGEGLGRAVGDGSFQGASSSPAETGSTKALSLADLDGNGVLDLITAGNSSGGPGYATVYLGNGDGTFKGALSYLMEQSGTSAVQLVDLDNDGTLDLMTAGARFQAVPWAMTTVRLGRGDGTFGAATSYAMGGGFSAANAISVADVDNDGVLDVVTAGMNCTSVRLGNGDGTFKQALSYRMDTSSASAVSLFDLDNNGIGDLVTAGQGAGDTGCVSIGFGNGDGTFKAAFSYSMESDTANALSIVYINSDGLVDLVTAGSNGSQGYSTIRLGNGDGTFEASVSYLTESSSSYALSLSDLNGDGVQDLVTAGRGSDLKGYATIRLGNGDGTFKAASSSQTGGYQSLALALSDLDRNGVVDLITGGHLTVGGGGGFTNICLGTTARVTTMPRLNLLSQKDARISLDFLKGQLNRISSELGAFGSFESRVSVASNVLQVSRENYLAANSRIEDADIASESASLVRNQILQQAASSVLAQTNQAPSLALMLLG